ncbi:hypothetical protein JCM8547_008882 [Rhodosporidiobolus lusitaniae]
MTSMIRRTSRGLQPDGSIVEDEDSAPPVPPKQSLWERAAQLPDQFINGGGGGYAAVPQDEATTRRRSYVELHLVGGGASPKLGGPVTASRRYGRRPGKAAAACCSLIGVSMGGLLAFVLFLAYTLFRPPSYHCPDPRLPRPSSLSLRHFSSPITLPSSDPNFSLSLRHSLTTCNSFDLLISRTSSSRCSEMERSTNPADSDPELEKWIRQKMGPDSFNIQIEGAERKVMDIPSEYLGECRYLYRFRLNNGGRVWMNATWTYEDFEAFKELDAPEGSRPKPLIFMRPLTSAPLQLDLCPSTCASYTPPRLGAPSSFPPVIRPSAVRSFFSFLPFVSTYTSPPPPANENLPTCHHSTSSLLSGSYVPSPQLDLVHPPYPVPLDHRSTRPTAGLYTFVPSTCRWKHAGQRFRDHTSCLTKPHNAFLIGDSHARGVFDIVKHRLEGNDSVAEASPKALNKNTHVGNLFMEFMWDPYLQAGVDCDFIRKFDSIAISSGTHQLSWNCPRMLTLLPSLSHVLRTWPRLLRECHASSGASSQKHPKLVFLTLPSFHPQLHNHDCRTGPRISYVNMRLKEEAEENGWEVLDVEKYVAPVAVDQLVGDGVHYLRLDAAEPVADEYIDILDICGEE